MVSGRERLRLVAPPPAAPAGSVDVGRVPEHPAGSARTGVATRPTRADRRRVLLVGDTARDLPARHGRTVVGHLGDRCADPVVVDLRRDAPRLVTLGRPEDAVEVARATRAGTVVLSADDLGPARTDDLVRRLSRDGRHVEVLTAVRGVGRHRLRTTSGQAGAVVAVAPVGRYTWREGAKRATDVLLASVLLVLCAPVLAAAALAVRAVDGPGVVFRQRRVGRDGTVFTLLKLRTMVTDAEQQLGDLLRHNEAAGPMFKMRDDPRVTRVGRVLRSTSLDELPQLVNVLRGEMSLVGPRPALPREVAQWDDGLRERLRVRPGLTGPWQVHGRFTASLEEYERLDVGYVDNWTLLGDLQLLVLTVPAVLGRHGAA